MLKINDLVTVQNCTATILHIYPATRIAPYAMARVEYVATARQETLPLTSLKPITVERRGMFDVLTIGEAIALEMAMNRAHLRSIDARDHFDVISRHCADQAGYKHYDRLNCRQSQMQTDFAQVVIDLRNRA